MSPIRYILLLILLPLATASNAEVRPGHLPGEAIWYLHADLEQLRSSESGKHIYQWLDGEVFLEIREEVGIDLNREAESVTAFADAVHGTVIVVKGPIAESSRNKLLALAALEAKLETLSHDGKTYYHAAARERRSSGNRRLDDFNETAYFSFDVKDKLIVASNRNQMEALLERDGRIAGNQNPAGALFVLTADKSFVQAGVRTAPFADEGGGWDSNILRNTEQVALLVSDRDGLIALDARLVSHEPMMARSLGGIINGLISLQMLAPDPDPNILALIENTKIDVKDRILSISTIIEPKFVLGVLEN